MTMSIGIFFYIYYSVVGSLFGGGIGFSFASQQLAFPFLLMASLVASLQALGACIWAILSPQLFVVVMEALSWLLDRTVQGGYFSGFMVGNHEGSEVMVTHLLFCK